MCQVHDDEKRDRFDGTEVEMRLRWDVNRDGPGLPRDWRSGLGFHCINLVHLFSGGCYCGVLQPRAMFRSC
jgi:hypothetical protein